MEKGPPPSAWPKAGSRARAGVGRSPGPLLATWYYLPPTLLARLPARAVDVAIAAQLRLAAVLSPAACLIM